MPVDRDLTAGALQLSSTDKDRIRQLRGTRSEVLVPRLQFAPAEGVLAVERQGIVKLERFTMKTLAETISVRVEAEWAPGVAVAVHLGRDGSARQRSGASRTPASPDARRSRRGTGAPEGTSEGPGARHSPFTRARRPSEPGGSTTIDVDARDAHGERPRPALQLALVVVDEAVLALSGYKLELEPMVSRAPRSARTGTRELWTRPATCCWRSRRRMGARSPGTGVGGGGEVPRCTRPLTAPRTEWRRQDPSRWGHRWRRRPLSCDISLEAKVMTRRRTAPRRRRKAPMPTPMATRYGLRHVRSLSSPRGSRPTRRGHAGGAGQGPGQPHSLPGDGRGGPGRSNQFQQRRTSPTARLLGEWFCSSPSRLLNCWRWLEMFIVSWITTTDNAMEVDVAAMAANAKVENAGRRVTVPANDRVEVRIPAAAEKVGTARFQIGAASGRFSDANQLELVVWTPATTEAFATYGTIDDGAIAQAVKVPSGVAPQFGGLEDHDVQSDRAAGADRRCALPGPLPLRVQRAALVARRVDLQLRDVARRVPDREHARARDAARERGGRRTRTGSSRGSSRQRGLGVLAGRRGRPCSFVTRST